MASFSIATFLLPCCLLSLALLVGLLSSLFAFSFFFTNDVAWFEGISQPEKNFLQETIKFIASRRHLVGGESLRCRRAGKTRGCINTCQHSISRLSHLSSVRLSIAQPLLHLSVRPPVAHFLSHIVPPVMLPTPHRHMHALTNACGFSTSVLAACVCVAQDLKVILIAITPVVKQKFAFIIRLRCSCSVIFQFITFNLSSASWNSTQKGIATEAKVRIILWPNDTGYQRGGGRRGRQ